MFHRAGGTGRAECGAALALAIISLAPTARSQHEHGQPQQPAQAQSQDPSMAGMQDMPGMQHGSMQHGEHAMQGLLGPTSAMRESSGTSWVPDNSPMHGLHFETGDWHWMVHGYANLVYDDQGGPRGDEDFFSANMLMLHGSRALGPGTLGFRTMLSLEPATVGDDGYPLLFQTGETSDGVTPLVDAQHAHDLFMELAATYSLPTGSGSSVFAYVGLPGEPALGPPTFMHRFSGEEIPEAPLTHHWLDSTHISYGVVTLGAILGDFKLDASVFNGREPDEDRWDIETGALDSESVRLSFNLGSDPKSNWAFQASYGNLHEPEELDPGVDVARSTISAIHGFELDDIHCQTTLAFGRNDPDPGQTSDAYLLESAVMLTRVDTVLLRLERVDKDELFTTGPLVGSSFTIDKLSLGYLREIAMLGKVSIAIGGLGSAYHYDDALDPAYGSNPLSFMLFLRARL
jgi:hypothetical protein